MDPENQDRIKGLVDTHGADDLVVVLGAADLESLEVEEVREAARKVPGR